MALTQVTITFLTYSAANPTVITTATVSVPIPAALAALDSPQTAAGQTGFQAFDTLLAGITKRAGFTYTDANGILNFIPLHQIAKIVGQ